MIFGHFIDFGHFPIEIPIEAENFLPTWEGVELERKQKKILKPVKQWEQLGNMHNWSFRKF